MKVHAEHVNLFDSSRELQLISVQIDSPFSTGELKVFPRTGTIDWTSPDLAAERVAKIKSITTNIFENKIDFIHSPDLIVFPEYSVPREAHEKDEIGFQSLSDKHKCIIIPGTFFDTRAGSQFYKNNVCHIYVPGRELPITITKATPTPEEGKALKPLEGFANIARLILPVPGRKEVGINVFICRDYLVPFGDVSGEPRQPIIQLDWDYEGIYLVVMNSPTTAVFQGAAALDVRRMRGPGKLVLLANCAKTGSEIGTALIGPSHELESPDTDIVKSVPPKAEGFLLASVRLWDIKLTKTSPDTTTDDGPIRQAMVYGLGADGSSNGELITERERSGPANLRAIWHPAFLRAIERCIVIEMYKVKSWTKAGEIFETKRISHVNAGFIRGTHDVLIRRYVPLQYIKSGQIPQLKMPFITFGEHEMAKIFNMERADPIKILIYPDSIKKYRGVEVTSTNFAEAEKQIKRVFPQVRSLDSSQAKREVLKNICKLAEQCNSVSDIPPTLKNIFSLGIENNIPIGKEFPNQLRETYVLIRATTANGNLSQQFENAILHGSLMKNDCVREIFFINSMMPNHQFQYLIKLKCTSYEADYLIHDVRLWAEKNDIIIGTRTIDLWCHLQRESVSGIAEMPASTEIIQFLEAIQAADQKVMNAISNEISRDERKRYQMLEIANEWARYEEIEIDWCQDCSEHLSTFYVNVGLWNFCLGEGRPRYARDASSAWCHIYRKVEESSSWTLKRMLEIDDAAPREEIFAAVKTRYPVLISEKDWQWLVGDLPQLLFRIANTVHNNEEVAKLCKEGRKGLDPVRRFRNAFTHETTHAAEIINIGHEDWQKRLLQIKNATHQLIELLDIIDRIIGHVIGADERPGCRRY